MASFSIRVILDKLGALLEIEGVIVSQNVLLSVLGCLWCGYVLACLRSYVFTLLFLLLYFTYSTN